MLQQRLLHTPTLEVKGVLSDDPTAVPRPEEFYSVKLAAANYKYQRTLTQLIHSSVKTNLINNLLVEGTALAEDLAALLEPNTKRNQSWALKLSIPTNRWSRLEFISYAHLFLLLPQLPHLGNAHPHPALDYDAKRCLCISHSNSAEALTDLQGIVDLHGKHARSNCPSCKAGTIFGHTSMKNVCLAAGERAGYHSTNEPTFTKLQTTVDTDVLAKIMPRQPTPGNAFLACRIIDEMARIDRLPFNGERDARQLALDARIAVLPPGPLLRVDAYLEDPRSELVPILIDVGANHPYAASNWPSEHKRTMAIATIRAGDPHAELPAPLLTSPTLAAYDKAKHIKYEPLVRAIHHERKHGHRPGPMPEFVPIIASTTGAILGFHQLKRLLGQAMHRKLLELGPRDDGKLASDIVGTFLYDVKVSLIAAAQRGLARSMLAAGRPYRRPLGGGA